MGERLIRAGDQVLVQLNQDRRSIYRGRVLECLDAWGRKIETADLDSSRKFHIDMVIEHHCGTRHVHLKRGASGFDQLFLLAERDEANAAAEKARL